MSYKTMSVSECEESREKEAEKKRVSKIEEKEKFKKYVKVQMSGATNMFDVRTVCSLSGLEREDVLDVMDRYDELSKKYGDDQ